VRRRPGSRWPCRSGSGSQWCSRIRRGGGGGSGQGASGYLAPDAAGDHGPEGPLLAAARRRAGHRERGHHPASRLKKGDLVIIDTNQIIPGDGEVIEGIASVDESAITGESAP